MRDEIVRFCDNPNDRSRRKYITSWAIKDGTVVGWINRMEHLVSTESGIFTIFLPDYNPQYYICRGMPMAKTVVHHVLQHGEVINV